VEPAIKRNHLFSWHLLSVDWASDLLTFSLRQRPEKKMGWTQVVAEDRWGDGR
jgi:hypothetical protein